MLTRFSFLKLGFGQHSPLTRATRRQGMRDRDNQNSHSLNWRARQVRRKHDSDKATKHDRRIEAHS
jgi:hypothetical protein